MTNIFTLATVVALGFVAMITLSPRCESGQRGTWIAGVVLIEGCK